MASDFKFNRALSNIKAAILDYPDSKIAGGVLRPLIDKAAPDIDIRELSQIPSGPGALTRFVELYLRDVLPGFDNFGGDNVYYINRGNEISVQGSMNSVWKVFVSPYSRSIIVFNKIDGAFSVISSIDDIGENQIEIPRVTPDEHLALRVRFQETIEDSYAAILKNNNLFVSEENPIEYSEWANSIKEIIPIIYRKWGEYRRNGLRDIFISRAASLNLTDDEKGKYEKAVFESEQQAYVKGGAKHPMQSTPIHFGASQPPRARPASVSSFSDSAPRAQTDPLEEARNFAHFAVDMMNYNELRAMPLSLGVLLDLIQNSR